MFAMVRAHWIDVGGTSTGFGAGADRRRPLARRAAARPAQDLRGGQAQRAALPRHQGQHPLPGILARRHEIADGGLPPRRRAASTSCSTNTAATRCSRRSTRSSTRPSGNAATWCAQLPDGVYEASASIDDDGVHQGRRRCRSTSRSRSSRGDMTIDLSGCSAERKAGDQLAHLCRRARRLQGADRPARSGQRRLVPRAQGDHPGRQHHDGALPGADGGLERHRADRGRHHRHGARQGDAATACRPGITRCSAAPWCSSAPIRRPSGASWCRASRAAAGAAGRSRTASPATVSVCQGDVRNGSIEGIELKCPVVVESRALRTGLLRRRKISAAGSASTCRCATWSRANGISRCRGAANARPGASAAARRASPAAIS